LLAGAIFPDAEVLGENAAEPGFGVDCEVNADVRGDIVATLALDEVLLTGFSLLQPSITRESSIKAVDFFIGSVDFFIGVFACEIKTRTQD
jgi:hypothetical protein